MWSLLLRSWFFGKLVELLQNPFVRCNHRLCISGFGVHDSPKNSRAKMLARKWWLKAIPLKVAVTHFYFQNGHAYFESTFFAHVSGGVLSSKQRHIQRLCLLASQASLSAPHRGNCNSQPLGALIKISFSDIRDSVIHVVYLMSYALSSLSVTTNTPVVVEHV